MVTLYDVLARVMPSPIVELNRAVAISMASGPGSRPAAGRAARRDSGRSSATTCCTAVRGDLLDKLGRHAEAAAEFERAARLATNMPERELSERRARASRARAAAGATGPQAVTGGVAG